MPDLQLVVLLLTKQSMDSCSVWLYFIVSGAQFLFLGTLAALRVRNQKPQGMPKLSSDEKQQLNYSLPHRDGDV